MYIIPHPTTEPELWEAKLFITPSRSITLTAIALMGTCFLVGFIILLLHLKEKRQDRREKMQDAQRFHFDAM
jgi:integrin alpha FG-GAP repeat containing protein 1